MQGILFQIIIKQNYELWVFKKTFPSNNSWYFLLVLIYGISKKSLSMLTAEMQEEHKYGEDILCPLVPTERMLTRREHRVKKLNTHFCLVLHILFFLTLWSKETYMLVSDSYFWQDYSEELGRTVGWNLSSFSSCGTISIYVLVLLGFFFFVGFGLVLGLVLFVLVLFLIWLLFPLQGKKKVIIYFLF